MELFFQPGAGVNLCNQSVKTYEYSGGVYLVEHLLTLPISMCNAAITHHMWYQPHESNLKEHDTLLYLPNSYQRTS